jgi:acetylornithine/N-succinyldiaminopimelate aminotransferase
LTEVNRKSGYFRQMLEGLVASHPTVFELVRGSGLMLGLKCKVINTDFVSGGYNQFLLTVPGGDNVVRLLPALNISDSELKLAVSKLEQTARELESK